MKHLTDYETDLYEWLKAPENLSAYLNAVLEEGDKSAMLLALREVAQANGGSQDAPESQSDLTINFPVDNKKAVVVTDGLCVQIFPSSKSAVAPPPPKIIPKSPCGISSIIL